MELAEVPSLEFPTRVVDHPGAGTPSCAQYAQSLPVSEQCSGSAVFWRYLALEPHSVRELPESAPQFERFRPIRR
jgi:hypothetical protein